MPNKQKAHFLPDLQAYAVNSKKLSDYTTFGKKPTNARHT